jgi:hypothetical protein
METNRLFGFGNLATRQLLLRVQELLLSRVQGLLLFWVQELLTLRVPLLLQHLLSFVHSWQLLRVLRLNPFRNFLWVAL